MNQERLIKGLWIPIEIWESKELTWNEKILFLEIDSFTSKNKDCYISNDYIAKLLNVTETSANKILSSLIRKGYVIKVSFDGRKRYVKSALSYMTSQGCSLEQGSLAVESNIPNTCTNTCTNKEDIDKSISKKDALNALGITEEQLRTIVESKKESDNCDIVNTTFDKAWNLYEKKGNKKLSMIRWKKLSIHNKKLALENIPKYVLCTPDKQYRKNFESYINQEVWNDELPKQKKSDEPKHGVVTNW